jgi:ABC-2 type transport system permease protein
MMLVVMVAALTGLFLVVRMYLQIPLAGSYMLFALGMALYLFALTSLGIFLACMSQNMPQLGLLIILVLMPLEMLSGSATPQESMPEWVQKVMQFAPTTHFVNITQGILFRSAGIEAMWIPFLKLMLIGAVLYAISLKRFRQSVA